MIACWFYKRGLSQAVDAERPLSPRLARHVRACAACRRSYQSELQIAEQLVAEASRECKAPSPFLRRRIIASLPEAEAEFPAKRPYARWGLPWPIAAVGLALVLVPALLWIQKFGQGPAPANPGLTAADTSNGITEPFESIVKLPTRQQLWRWSEDWDRPLEAELQSVVNDAKSALHGLAQNFLPANLRGAALGAESDR